MDTMKHKDVENGYKQMRMFYTTKVFPKDGEHLLIDGEEYTAHLKGENEDCRRCCFSTSCGCGVALEKLDCFDLMQGRRYYFTKEKKDGEENNGEQGTEGGKGFCRK